MGACTHAGSLNLNQMFVIVKEVGGFRYYLNEEKERWEGLIDNATKYTQLQVAALDPVEGNFIELEEKVFHKG